MRGRLHLLLISLALMGLVVVLAPDSRRAAAEDTSRTRVAHVQGTETYLAVTYDGRRLRAYACNGSARRPATLSKWFEARWDGRGPVTMVNGEAELRVERRDAGGLIGGELNGHRFTRDAGERAGRARTSATAAAEPIVLADGSLRSC